jgi:hypothetical protein
MRVEGIVGVLPGTSMGSFATLLSPPHCHAAFGTMPHIVASVEQNLVYHSRTLPPSSTRTPRVGFWRGKFLVVDSGGRAVKA